MSRSYTKSFITQLFLFISVLAVVGAVSLVSGQNSNSSLTMQNDNKPASNMSGTKRRSSKRRGRRGSMASSPAACGPMQENTNMASEGQEGAGSMKMAPVKTGGCDPNAQEQTDLSGTYTGTANYSEGGLSGDATLTISGNDFTLTSGSTTQEGRVVAVTTCNYTAVTMMFGKWQAAAPGAAQPALLPTVSLQAKKVGNTFALMSVPGEKREFSFSAKAASASSATSAGGTKRRVRTRKPKSKMSGNACNPMAHPAVSR